MVICGLWKDSRVLRLAENQEILYLPNFDDYFVPDFYIYDLLDFKLSHFGEKNIRILSLTSEDKLRFYSEGIVTIACSMDFIKYPFDSHQCKFLLGSTGYTYSRMRFTSTFSYSENGQRPLQYKVSTYLL